MRGHIKKRGKTWYVVIYLGVDETGKKKYKWVSIKDDVTGKSTKEMAEKALPDILRKVYSGSFTDCKDVTVKDYMKEWLEYKRKDVKYNTWRQYDYASRLYIVPAIGKIKLDKLRPPHIRKLHEYCFKHDVSKSTVTRTHATIRSALSYAVEMEMIPRNVAKLVSAPGENEFNIEPLSESEFTEYFHIFKDENIFMHFLISVATGLREGEICALRWKDIDTDKMLISVKHTLVRVKEDKNIPGKLTLTPAKTKKSVDEIPIPDELVKYLRKHKVKQAQAKLIMGQDYTDEDYVCAWEDGRPFDPSYVSKKFNKVIKKHGLRKVRFHDLRHTFGTILVNKGVPLPTVQSMLRHSDRRTTERYTHGTKSAKEEAANKINNIIKGC